MRLLHNPYKKNGDHTVLLLVVTPTRIWSGKFCGTYQFEHAGVAEPASLLVTFGGSLGCYKDTQG